MDPDPKYLERLVAEGQAFSYRRARRQDDVDPGIEFSKERWTEWITKAELAVRTLARPTSRAHELIREAKHLEVIGELPDDFYRCREAALNALRLCARELRNPPVGATVSQYQPSQDTRHPTSSPTFWERFGVPIVIGTIATVIGGLLLALLL